MNPPDNKEKQTMTTTFVREIALRYRNKKRLEPLNPITSPDKAAEFIRKILPDNVREHFVALFLDSAHHVSGFYVVATGTANSCPVGIREVFQGAILAGALGLVVSHNHPSGNVVPSHDDHMITKRLIEAGALLGIPVIDHVIVGPDKFYSFKENGDRHHSKSLLPPQ